MSDQEYEYIQDFGIEEESASSSSSEDDEVREFLAEPADPLDELEPREEEEREVYREELDDEVELMASNVRIPGYAPPLPDSTDKRLFPQTLEKTRVPVRIDHAWRDLVAKLPGELRKAGITTPRGPVFRKAIAALTENVGHLKDIVEQKGVGGLLQHNFNGLKPINWATKNAFTRPRRYQALYPRLPVDTIIVLERCSLYLYLVYLDINHRLFRPKPTDYDDKDYGYKNKKAQVKAENGEGFPFVEENDNGNPMLTLYYGVNKIDELELADRPLFRSKAHDLLIPLEYIRNYMVLHGAYKESWESLGGRITSAWQQVAGVTKVSYKYTTVTRKEGGPRKQQHIIAVQAPVNLIQCRKFGSEHPIALSSFMPCGDAPTEMKPLARHKLSPNTQRAESKGVMGKKPTPKKKGPTSPLPEITEMTKEEKLAHGRSIINDAFSKKRATNNDPDGYLLPDLSDVEEEEVEVPAKPSRRIGIEVKTKAASSVPVTPPPKKVTPKVKTPPAKVEVKKTPARAPAKPKVANFEPNLMQIMERLKRMESDLEIVRCTNKSYVDRINYLETENRELVDRVTRLENQIEDATVDPIVREEKKTRSRRRV